MRVRARSYFIALALLGTILLPATLIMAGQEISALSGNTRGLLHAKSVPDQLNYQGHLANAADSSAVTATLEMTFRLFDSENKGAELWSEMHPTVEVSDGLFQVLLGSITTFPGGLFDTAELWLQTEIGGEMLMPRKPLASVAYSQMAGEAGHAVTAGNATTSSWAAVAQHAVRADTADICPGFSAWIVDGDDVYRTAGKVGIGTDSPAYTLDVDGTVGASAFYGDGSNLTGISGAADADWTIDGNDVYHQPGNVGIGTDSPAYPLDVNGAVNAATYYGDGSNLTGISGSADADWTIRGDTVYHQTGPVGIGTSVPTAPLTIGAAVGDDILFTSGGSNADIKAEAEFRIGTSTSQPLHLVTDNNFRLTVLAGDGHVGIGTTTPGYPLDVNGAVNATTYYGDGSNLTGISGTTDNDWTIAGNDIYSAVSGDVGIGTSGPIGKLHVVGSTGYYAQLGRSDRAVYGVNPGTNYGHLAGTYGAYGSDIGSGNFGYLGSGSRGVHGEHGTSGNFAHLGTANEAIYGYNDGNGNKGYIATDDHGVKGIHDSSSNYGYLGGSSYGVYGSNHDSGNSGELGSPLVGAAGHNDSTGYYGWLGTNDYGVYYSGGISGTGKGGLIVRTHDGPREMNFHQTTESWCEDFGSGLISGGRAEIRLADDYLQTVTVSAAHPLKVFITPNERIGEWWVEKNISGFTLVAPEAPDGARFDYRVAAKQRGYEHDRLILVPAGYADHNLYPNITDVPPEYRERWRHNIPNDGVE